MEFWFLEASLNCAFVLWSRSWWALRFRLPLKWVSLEVFLFGEEPTIPEEEASKSVDFICNGNRSVLGTFEDMKDVEIIQHIDFKRFVLKADFNSLLEGEQAATIKDENYISSHFMEDRNLNKVCRSSLILIKFLEEMVLYYKELQIFCGKPTLLSKIIVLCISYFQVPRKSALLSQITFRIFTPRIIYASRTWERELFISNVFKTVL